MEYRKYIFSPTMYVQNGYGMKQCQSMKCENTARYIFKWSIPSESCGCPACLNFYKKLFCPRHMTAASNNLTGMGHKFSKQVICIMERT